METVSDVFEPTQTSDNGAQSLRSRFLSSADHRPSKVVDIELPVAPDSDETATVKIGIRAILAGDRAKFMRLYSEDEGALERLSFDLLIQSCFDPETGGVLFTEGDRAALGRMPAGPIETLVGEILVLSGLDQGAKVRAGKGSRPSPSASSTSS